MSAPINVAIRADAGYDLGTGHFSRASAVANALLQQSGVNVVLVTVKSETELIPAFFADNIDSVSLEDDQSTPEQVLTALTHRGTPADIVFLDHYADIPEWEAATTRAGIPIAVLDDLEKARHANIIVRPHRAIDDASCPTSPTSIYLQGSTFLPLSDHIIHKAALRDTTRKIQRERLNICFGGSDPSGETIKALEAVNGFEDLDIDVVLGPGSKFDGNNLQKYERLSHVNIHYAPSQAQLARLLTSADMAVGAGGVMAWERLYLGLPSLVICVADNQRAQIDWMNAQGAIRFLGDHINVTHDALLHNFSAFRENRAARARMAEIGRCLVDGRGAVRLAAILRALTLTVRRAVSSDAHPLWEWRTDDRNWRYNYVDAGKPNFTGHLHWFLAKLANPDCLFLIVEDRGDPVGVVRFDLNQSTQSANLSIYLVPHHHGRRLSLPVYFAAEHFLQIAHPEILAVVSKLHTTNRASMRIHADAGFTFSLADRNDWLSAARQLLPLQK